MSIAMAIRGYMGINRPSPVPPMGLNGTWPGIAKTEKKRSASEGRKWYKFLSFFFHFQGDRFHIVFKIFGQPTKMEKKWKNRFQKQLRSGTHVQTFECSSFSRGYMYIIEYVRVVGR